MKYLSDLFTQSPPHYSLRGDYHLWKEFIDYYSTSVIPKSKQDLIGSISDVFKELTNHNIEEMEYFYLERLAHGGMSSGMVNPVFWKETVTEYIWCLANGEDYSHLF